MIKIGILGYFGFMGRALQKELLHDPDVQIIPIVRLHDVRNTSLEHWVLLDKLTEKDIDVLVDFSSPAGMLQGLSKCMDLRIAYVGGVTGIDEDIKQYLYLCAKKIPLVYSSNFSIGITAILQILPRLASLLQAEDFDVEILDIHHRYKKDSPSGTAKTLAQAVAKGRHVEVQHVMNENSLRSRKLIGEIGMASLRGGHVFGIHEVHFLGKNEQVMITHKANDKMVFAKGALLATKWIVNKKAGFYEFYKIILEESSLYRD